MIRSTVAVSYEVDDVKLAAAELCDSTLEKVELLKNSFGILICDSDTEHSLLLSEIRKKLDMPIVGFSSMTMFTGEHGMIDTAACLATLTSDDVFFSVATSAPLNLGNVESEIEKTYKKAAESLTGEPAAIMAFPPYLLGIMLDIYPRELGRVSGGLPVFGGLPAHDEMHGRSAVFCCDSVRDDRLTLLLVSNAAKPIFSVKNIMSNLANIKRVVTCSEGNIVYRIGDQTFVEFLESFGLDVKAMADSKDRTVTFTAYPLLLEMTAGEESESVPVVRTIQSIDLDKESGTAIGEIPQGASISLGALKALDIERSAKQSADEILAKMSEHEKNGYKYSFIFAVSCIGRYLVLAGRNDLEANVLRKNLPDGISLCGFYSFGEVAPISISGGRVNNAAHNESLVIMAI